MSDWLKLSGYSVLILGCLSLTVYFFPWLLTTAWNHSVGTFPGWPELTWTKALFLIIALWLLLGFSFGGGIRS